MRGADSATRTYKEAESARTANPPAARARRKESRACDREPAIGRDRPALGEHTVDRARRRNLGADDLGPALGGAGFALAAFTPVDLKAGILRGSGLFAFLRSDCPRIAIAHPLRYLPKMLCG